MKKYFLTILIAMLLSSPAIAQNQKNLSAKNISLTVKITIFQDNQESESDEYTFLLSEGQNGIYENSSTIPYWPKQGDATVEFVQEKTKINVKPTLKNALSIVESQIEGCMDTQKSMRNDGSVPNISCFSHSGSSIIQGDQYTAIFDGKFSADKSRRLKIFIKVTTK